MLDIINKLLASDIAKWLLVAVVVVNAALSALSGALALVGKVAPAWIKPVVDILKKVVDFFSANLPH